MSRTTTNHEPLTTHHSPVSPDANWLRRFRRKVRTWYARNARDLPWRRTRDPYRVWISEIMLQQTTVAAVAPYFERFIRRFPTLERLAEAAEHEVLKLWEGLGYYSRARNVHRAARSIVREHGGEFPQHIERLIELPGVGRYTAGAIASFAFDRPAPIVEANTLRLYCRLAGYRGDPRSSDGRRFLWEFAERLVPRKEPGRFNQALMELGARVCTPAAPGCERCPVRTCCRAFAEGIQHEVPRPPPRTQTIDVVDAMLIVQCDGRYLLRRRRPDERWAGLWDFPRYCLWGPDDWAAGGGLLARRPARKLTPPARRRIEQMLEARLAEDCGLEAGTTSLLAELRHGVTRYAIRLLCFAAEHLNGEPAASESCRWVPARELPALAVPATTRRLAQLLASGEKFSASH